MYVQYRLRAVGFDDSAEPRGDLTHRFVPGQGFEAPFALRADAAHRCSQAAGGVAPLAVIGGRTLAAQAAAAHRMQRIAAHLAHRAIAFDDGDSTRVVAVAWAGREEHFILRLVVHATTPL